MVAIELPPLNGPANAHLPRHPKRLGQKRTTRTIAHTMPHPIHVMFGWAGCHSKIRLWNATAGYVFAFSFKRDSSVTALWQ